MIISCRLPKVIGMVTLLSLFLSFSVAMAADKTVQFSGYTWIVRPAETGGGPGPNNWDPNNVWVDTAGNLHLALTQKNGQWTCAELYTQKSLGFGRYQFWLNSRVDKLDPNVVLGLFPYPDASLGPDGTNEIDIEFARWGNPAWPNLNYTVWPGRTGFQPTSQTSNFVLNGDYSTHRFTWTSKNVTFQSLYGHYNDNTNQFQQWIYQPSNPLNHISQGAMPLHINLWAFEGHPPTDNKPVEVIISSFTYQPLTSTTTTNPVSIRRKPHK